MKFKRRARNPHASAQKAARTRWAKKLDEDELKFKCPYCGVGYATAQNRDDHIQVMRQRFHDKKHEG